MPLRVIWCIFKLQ